MLWCDSMVRFQRKSLVLVPVFLFALNVCWTYHHMAMINENNMCNEHRFQLACNTSKRLSGSEVAAKLENSDKEKFRAEAEIFQSTMTEVLNRSIKVDRNKPIITLFTTWTEERARYLVHNLTVRNWQSFRPYIIPVVFTNETAVAENCRQNGWEVLPVRISANGGIPVLKFMFLNAISAFNTPFYGFCNSDILFTDSLLETLAWLKASLKLDEPFLIIGKRTNVNFVKESENVTWKKLSAVAFARGKLFRGLAEDYFITSRSYPWMDIPEVVIGRPAFDNWLVFYTRKRTITVIDGTRTILAVHQTTSAGNIEGQFRPNSSYNKNVLSDLYGDINFDAGFVDCANLSTKYENGVIKIVGRKVPSFCRLTR